MMKSHGRLGLMVVVLAFAQAILASESTSRPYPTVDDDGALHRQNDEVVPYSDLASPEARRNYIERKRSVAAYADRPAAWKPKPGETEIQVQRRWIDEKLMIPWLARVRQAFAVDIKPEIIGGVQTDVVTPKEGIAPRNRHRVLINLHGGGMQVGARYGGQLESVPIASVGLIKVVTVDYRMAPEHRYPAAEEDVAAVYRELLKIYRPKSIGIYGCSAGAYLTGSSTALLMKQGVPKPGAIGMFGWGPLGRGNFGDSNYIFTGGKAELSRAEHFGPNSYTAGLDLSDATLFPVEDAKIQALFPPSLLISGTRDIGLSRTVYAHTQLVDLDVEADLHVWEGAPHCSFAQPFVDASVPESQQAWKVITRFFDKHLERQAK